MCVTFFENYWQVKPTILLFLFVVLLNCIWAQEYTRVFQKYLQVRLARVPHKKDAWWLWNPCEAKATTSESSSKDKIEKHESCISTYVVERIQILHACAEMKGLFTPVAPRISVLFLSSWKESFKKTFFMSDRKYISKNIFLCLKMTFKIFHRFGQLMKRTLLITM